MFARVALVCALAIVRPTGAMADQPAAQTATATEPPTEPRTEPATDSSSVVGPLTAPAPASASASIGPARRAAAITLAIIPGVGARGLGSYVAHQPGTARRLLALGSIGLGAALVGGLPLYATYGSGKLIVPGVHLTVGGAGLIMASWWSDIYGAAGGERLGGRPRTLPALAVELGTTWQHHAYLGERLLLAPAAELRRGRWAARAAGLLATDGSAAGARVDVETRAWSIAPTAAPTVAAARHTGSAIAFRAALHYHGEPDQHFALVTGELAVRGRLDLGRLDPHVRGTFVELEEGLGLQVTSYDVGSADVGTILLSRFAWGIYLPGGRGELGVFYDHRRDQMAGGFRAGPAAGFFGSIGTTAEIVLASRWTGFAQVEVGTDWVTTVALRRELP